MAEEQIVQQPYLDEDMQDAQANPADDAALVAEEARLLFEGEALYSDWLPEYFLLREEGWSFRQAVYILWASQPKSRREPATEYELATMVLGLSSARAIRQWKTDNPHLELRIKKLQLAALGHHRAEVLDALAQSAKDPDYKSFRDRELYLKMTGMYKPTTAVEVGPVTTDGLGDLSEDELAALAQIPVDASGN